MARFRPGFNLDPSFADSYYQKGVALMELGQNRRAIEDFDQFISLNPDAQFVRYDRQIALERATEKGK